MPEVQSQETKKPKVLPKPNSDFYQTLQMLSEAEQQTVSKVRAFMEKSVAPVINDFWEKDSFPFDVLPGVPGSPGYGSGIRGLWMCRWQQSSGLLYRHGDSSDRLLLRHLLRCA